jgi:hypothetical protein
MLRSVVVISLISLSLARPAAAETMLDLYVGGAFTEGSVLEVQNGPLTTLYSADWNTSPVFGIRAGYWFEGPLRWFGLAGDLSYFRPDLGSDFANLHTFPLTPMVMIRIPLLEDDVVPAGRLQPYAGIGPGLFTTVLTSDTFSDRVGFDAGLDVRAGISIRLTRTFGLFAEYRRTDVDVRAEDSDEDRAKTTIETDHITGGIALRF